MDERELEKRMKELAEKHAQARIEKVQFDFVMFRRAKAESPAQIVEDFIKQMMARAREKGEGDGC